MAIIKEYAMERVLTTGFILFLTNLVLCETSCPDPCECRDETIKDKVKKIIDCSHKNLHAVPSFVSVDRGVTFDKLFLNDNQITNLQARAFRGLNVRHLDISNNNIKGMSDSAFKSLSGLQELVAENTGLTATSIALSMLEHLKILRLANNSIEQLDVKALGPLKNLHYLDVSNNKPMGFPYPFTAFQNLKKLKTLKLANCDIKNMPADGLEDIAGKLKVLVLRDNHIRDVPSGLLQKLRILEVLDLENNPIKFSSGVRDFREMRELKVLKVGQCDMDGHQLNTSFFKDSKKLKTLVIRACNIKKTQANVFKELHHLQHLDISGNPIPLTKELFSGVGGRLFSVGLENMTLTQFPRFIFSSFGKAKNISLGYNTFSHLPAGAFGSLQQGNTYIRINNAGVNNINVYFLQDAHLPMKIDLSGNSISRLDFLTANPCNFAGADLDLTGNPINCDPVCGTLLTMQKKAFNVKGECKAPRGTIGYQLMWNPGMDPLQNYIELNKSEECGAEMKQNMKYSCCDEKWVSFETKLTCGTQQITSIPIHFFILCILLWLLS